ncbi:MAG: DUF2284 domain-containing protein [Coriobacteriia bacterium]|nr:DUF2284 domain-containing protein [Coriobacteriia bacterium]
MDLETLIQDAGFPFIGRFDVSRLEFREDVRAMCAVDTCHSYDKNWSCPPACGSVAHYREELGCFTTGYLFQTVVQMEDAFDYAAIERGGKEHAQRLVVLQDRLQSADCDVLLLGAGACMLCERCTYPEAPCCHPDRMLVSMEATGLLVSEVCELAGVPYYHGKDTLAFCSCVLV